VRHPTRGSLPQVQVKSSLGQEVDAAGGEEGQPSVGEIGLVHPMLAIVIIIDNAGRIVHMNCPVPYTP